MEHEGDVAERRGVGHGRPSVFGGGAALAEHLLGPGELAGEVGDREVELGALRLHRPQPLAAERVGGGELRRLLVVDVVELEQLADVLEAEAEALALEDQLEAGAAAAGVEPLLALADRGEQLLGLVEAQRARGHAEGGADLADALEVVGHGAGWVGHGRTMPGRLSRRKAKS